MSEVTLWRPNWGEGVRERLEWRTAIIESWDGSEHRHRVRSLPRVTWEYSVVASGDRRRALVAGNAAIASAERVAIDLPIWSDIANLTQQCAATTSTLYCDTSERGFVGGAKVALVNGDTAALVTISAVASATALTTAAPLAATWPADTAIYPVRSARLVSAVEQHSLAPDVSSWRVAFIADDLADPWEGDEGPDEYWGLPVWALRPNWRDGVRWRTERPLFTVDGEAGPIGWYGDGTSPDLRVTHRYTALGRTALGALRRALYARAGRAVACWMPSYQRDVRLAAAADAADDVLTVAASGWVDLAGNAEHRHLQIVLWDGTILYAEVTGGATLTATTERLDLQAAIGQDLALADIRRISWMYWCRQDTDQVELAYAVPDVVEADVTWRRPRLRLATELAVEGDPPAATTESLAQTAPAAPGGALAYLMPPDYAASSDPEAEDTYDALAQVAPAAPSGGLAELVIAAAYDASYEALAQTAPGAPSGSLT